MLNSLFGEEARKNMKTLIKQNIEPRKAIIGITNTDVTDSKGKNPAYDSKTSMGNGGSDSEELELVLFIIFLINCLVMCSILCVYLNQEHKYSAFYLLKSNSKIQLYTI